MVLYAAASMDGKKYCRRWRHAQLTPLYGLVRRILLLLVAAATFIARERRIIGGLARYRATTYISSGSAEPSPTSPNIAQFTELMDFAFLG
jgi:hypothetical protein